MNLQSEVDYYSEIRLADKARLMASFLYELTTEARATYGASQDAVHDAAHLRFVNEICNRVCKLIEQYLGDDKARPALPSCRASSRRRACPRAEARDDPC